MPQRFYFAVLERGAHDTFGVWFPDFPGAVCAGRTQEEAMARAEEALAEAVHILAEHDQPLPDATPSDVIELPADCDLVTFFAVRADPPDPSERVNVYLPRSLIERADRRAADLGMSRSSFFGLALTRALWAEGQLWADPQAAAVRARGRRR